MDVDTDPSTDLGLLFLTTGEEGSSYLNEV